MATSNVKRKEKENATNTLQFTLSSNLIIVDSTINGAGAKMILDTGAGATIVSKKAAERFGLEIAGTSCPGMGAGGDVQMDTVEIDSLVVGSVSHRNVKSMTMDLSSICGKLEEEVDGIIGYDILSSTRLTIDYPARQLVLQEAPA
jgi:clan AA aspartic protease (TIGR02281 family)